MILQERVEHYYQNVPGYFDFPEVYRHAVEWLPDGGTFVEVGSWQGQSLAFLLVEAHNSGKLLKVFGVDHFRGSVNDVIQEEAKLKSIAAHCMHNLRRAACPYALINAESTVGATFFEDESIDYLFIDASHDKPSVVADLEIWLPKVKPGGIAAGHDYNQPAVREAVDAAFPGLKIEHLKDRTATQPHGYQWGTCWRVQL